MSIEMSSLLSDGMVLQRNSSVRLWGRSGGNKVIQAAFRGETYSTKADADGIWELTLENLEPGGPDDLVLSSGEAQIIIRDVLVGDVWVLAGQSNMELPIRRTLDLLADEIRDVNLPMIRQFSVPMSYNFQGPQEELSGGAWISAVSDDVLGFSAAGFYFAREIHERYGVPIGLIQTAVGGTPIEAWLSEPTLRGIGSYEAVLEQCKSEEYIQGVIKRDEDRNQRWYARLNETDAGLQERWQDEAADRESWLEVELPGSWEGSELEAVRGAVWFRREIDIPETMTEDEAFLALGTIVDADDTYVNGVLVGSTGYRYPPRRYTVPKGILKPGKNTIAVRVISMQNTGEFVEGMPYRLKAAGQELDLCGTWYCRIGAVTEALEPQTFVQYMPSGTYNGMIVPLRRYPISGMLWYQGESNTGNPSGYSGLFHSMVRDWRSSWGIGDFPVIAVQLANFGPEGERFTDWAELREEQRKGLSVPNTALASAIDIGQYNDLHPQDKKTLGERLALCARKLAYGEEQLLHSGPVFAGMERMADHSVRLRFNHAGSGLATRDGKPLQGFSARGPEGEDVPAWAEISGSNTVDVSFAGLKPVAQVRYAWSNNPAQANLCNREGLPAFPFREEL